MSINSNFTWIAGYDGSHIQLFTIPGDNMSQTIPHSQRAALVQNPGESFKIVLQDDIPVGNPGPEEILVKLNCTGIW
jgi:hypothetical protein